MMVKFRQACRQFDTCAGVRVCAPVLHSTGHVNKYVRTHYNWLLHTGYNICAISDGVKR